MTVGFQEAEKYSVKTELSRRVVLGVLIVAQLVQQHFSTGVSDREEPAARAEVQAPGVLEAEPRP